MTSISSELAAAIDRYDRPNASAAEERAAEERSDLIRRFPLERWSRLPLEHYALGTGDDPVPYCAMLEYHTPYLGSIKGGSARKHIIYRQSWGGWWLAGPLKDLEPHDAWERLRHEFVAAIEAAQAGRLDDLDHFALLRWGPALVTKTFAVYAPQHFLRAYSSDHLRRFIRLFGGTPEPEATSWRLNQHLKFLVETVEPFSSWSQEQVLQFLYMHLDPRAGDEQVLKIAPGENARLWPECLSRRNIRIGFGEVPDLRTFTTDDALVATLESAYPDKGRTYHRKLARQLLRFRDLSPGARIVANRGTSEILAAGTVTDEGYRYDESLPEYRHVVGVDWDTSYAQHLAKPARGWVPTFNNVTSEQWAAIIRGREDVGRPDQDGRRTESVNAVPVPVEVERLLAALERKGQVIVHGPPGTGKTRLALTAALVLTGRGRAATGSPAERSEAIRDMLAPDDGLDGRILRMVMTSFHPSLGYEDFVEGFKPVPTSHGGLALAMTDGLFLRVCDAAKSHPEEMFVLLIDEINRADLARVLGELVTLLEMDKREDVTVCLPVSGRTFSLPRNIRIIGTMNTADRSVAHLDAAVRRRFGFLEASPDSTVLEAVVGPLNLASLLGELNQRISRHLTRDHQLGHAHLMADDMPVDSAEALAAAFYQDVVPQLEDYALGDRELLARILGEEIVDHDGQVVQLEPEDLLVTLAKEFAADETMIDV